MRPEVRGSGRAVSIQLSPTQRGSTRKSHAMKLNICPFRVSARSKTLGSGEIDWVGSSRDGQKTVHVSLDDRCHWEMKGPWQVALVACCDPTVAPTQHARRLRSHTHLPTFLTLHWRLKSHEKLKGLLIRTKKDKCSSPHPTSWRVLFSFFCLQCFSQPYPSPVGIGWKSRRRN